MVNSQYGLTAYNQWASSLPKGDSRRVPWKDLSPEEQITWHNLAQMVIQAHTQDMIREDANQEAAAEFAGNRSVPMGGQHFVTGMDARPTDVSERLEAPAGASGFGRVDGRIDQLEGRVSRLESIILTNYGNELNAQTNPA